MIFYRVTHYFLTVFYPFFLNLKQNQDIKNFSLSAIYDNLSAG